jgi:hypothetical protein
MTLEPVRMSRLILGVVLLLNGLSPLTRLQAATDSYSRGIAAFESKDYAAARDAFTAVIQSDQKISADLLFNLGNTFFRLGEPGTAALWYRRALLLDPTDFATRQNLRLLGGLTGFLEFGSEIRGALPIVTSVAISAGWLAAISLAALIFLRPRGRARAWLWAGLVTCILITGAALGILWKRVPPSEVARRAVVTKKVSALAAPTPTAGEIIDLPAGSEVSVKETRDSWSYVEIPGDRARVGSVGWVPREALSPLWPYSVELIK